MNVLKAMSSAHAAYVASSRLSTASAFRPICVRQKEDASMAHFSDWEFMLNCDTQEFRNLVCEPGTKLLHLYGGLDHWLDCPSDDFRMTTLYCEGESDAEVVWQVGYELLSLFNGASVLFNMNYQKASIYKLLHNEREVAYSAPRGSTALLGRPRCSSEQLKEELISARRSSIKFRLIHLAVENEDVYFILKYLDMEAGWVTYYKLLEAIEHFSKKSSVDLKIEHGMRVSFTNTANNFSLSGFDSRHGFKELTKKNNTASMTIREGHDFVTAAAKKYLKMIHFK